MCYELLETVAQLKDTEKMGKTNEGDEAIFVLIKAKEHLTGL